MSENAYYHVFIPGGVPTITYNPRYSLALEKKVLSASKNLCKLMIVTGQTKMGKTVLVDKIYNRQENIWIDGGMISDEESFWDNVIAQLNIPTQHDVVKGKEFNMNGDIGTQLKLGLFQPEANIAIRTNRMQSVCSRSVMSNKSACINCLSDNSIPLIVDDFHYINRDVQTRIVRALKAPIMHGLPVIFIAIPSRKFDVIKVEREMTGRIETFKIPSWSEMELQEIAIKGFHELKIDVEKNVIECMAKEALGSPHLMLMYGKEASNRKQEIDCQYHTIPNQRPKDKHYGNVHNRLFRHG